MYYNKQFDNMNEEELSEALNMAESPSVNIKTECDSCGFGYWVDWDKEDDVDDMVVGNRMCNHCKR